MPTRASRALSRLAHRSERRTEPAPRHAPAGRPARTRTPATPPPRSQRHSGRPRTPAAFREPGRSDSPSRGGALSGRRHPLPPGRSRRARVPELRQDSPAPSRTHPGVGPHRPARRPVRTRGRRPRARQQPSEPEWRKRIKPARTRGQCLAQPTPSPHIVARTGVRLAAAPPKRRR